jgi:hypothetical protein
MGKGFLDDVEGTRGNGFHSVADLQNMPQYKKDELKNAIDENNARLREAALSSAQKKKDAKAAKAAEEAKAAAKVQAAAIAAEQKRDSERTKVTPSQAASVSDVTIKNRKDSSGKSAGDTGYKSALKQRKEAQKSANSFTASKVKSYKSGKSFSGGFNKGGLMKKPNKK